MLVVGSYIIWYLLIILKSVLGLVLKIFCNIRKKDDF